MGLAFLAAACGESKEIGQTGFVKGFIGGVAADEPRAAIVGRDILGRGGSAADAATAMFFTLAVTKPSAASLGAVGGCVYYHGETKSFAAFDFTPKPIAQPPGTRPLIAVPGAVRGLAAMQARYGRLPWAELVGPAEALARFGHAVSRSLATDLAANEAKLKGGPGLVRVFGRADSSFAKEGDQVRQLELAGSLAQIRQRGAGALYSGSLANAYANGVQAIGGDLTIESIRAFLPRALDPIIRPAGDHLIAFLPTVTSNGPQQARLWRILAENRALSRADRDARLHVIAEASVLAHAEYTKVARQPGADLDVVDDAALNRLDQRFKTFDAARAQSVSDWLEGGPPIPSEVSGTTVVAVDRSGGAASCGFTLYRAFGAGRMLPGLGVLPALMPPPGIVSGALGPLIVGNKHTGNFFLALGGSGAGSSTTLVAIAARILLGDESINEAVGSPRFSRGGGPKTILIEKDVGQESQTALQTRGYTLEPSPNLSQVNGAYCTKGLPTNEELCDIRTDWRGHGLAASAR
jgi:gamma-glutamyltranspeptidase/glutathione hydrolase